jgi:hypothetical protein
MSRSKLSYYKINKIAWFFCVDIEASKTALLTGINRNTVNSYYQYFRLLIEQYQVISVEKIKQTENQEKIDSTLKHLSDITQKKQIRKQIRSYPVYGLYEKDGMVYSDLLHLELIRTATEKKKETFAVTGIQKNYHAVLAGMFPQLYILGKPVHTHLQQALLIESFWSFSKRRLQKFNGVPSHFYMHLKECEWRWKRKETILLEDLLQLRKQ